MGIPEVRREDNRQLQNIANTLAAAKKIVVITGAGISTNCGIPVSMILISAKSSTAHVPQDFRSEEGLYSLIQAKRDAATSKSTPKSAEPRAPLSSRRHTNSTPMKQLVQQSAKLPLIPSNMKGKDLFDAQLWKDPISTSVFYTFIASLRRTVHEDIKRVTSTHRFIRTLRDRRRLVRCYTQNIDGLESREGLCLDMERGKGNRARFTKQSLEKSRAVARTLPGGDLDSGCEVVQLHGDLEVLRCTLCRQTCSWDEHGRAARLLAGKAPTCQSCMTTNLDRQDRGKRGTKIGTLRPNIVLYGEEHPSADAVGTITAHDLALAPDLLLILGTSLHVHGLKVLVREFAKCVHARAGGKGKVIFVNLSKPSESAWKDAFDYWVSMDCDAWVGAMRRHRPDIFQVQDQLKLAMTKSSGDRLPKSVLTLDAATDFIEDKENIEARAMSTPSKKHPRPWVMVSPSKKTALQNSTLGSWTGTATEREETKQSVIVDRSHLPTPPSSGHRARFQPPIKKRSLADNYQDIFGQTSPKKRRTTSTPGIWEDPDPEI